MNKKEFYRPVEITGRPRMDLTGQKFGSLTVIEPDTTVKKKHTKWFCKCSCGNIVSVYTNALMEGVKTSCNINCSHKTKKDRKAWTASRGLSFLNFKSKDEALKFIDYEKRVNEREYKLL